MEETLTAPAEPKSPAEYKAAINALVAQMWQMHAQMERNRAEIERLQAETDAIKEDTEQIKARLQSRLDNLLARI
jgi:peptidoglycan hydrolase CwlO-like protein